MHDVVPRALKQLRDRRLEVAQPLVQLRSDGRGPRRPRLDDVAIDQRDQCLDIRVRPDLQQDSGGQ